MPRYRYISTGPVVFTQEVVDGKTWTPSPGEEADFDHEINHPFLLLVSGDAAAVADAPVVVALAVAPEVVEAPPVEPPAEPVVATEAAVSGAETQES